MPNRNFYKRWLKQNYQVFIYIILFIIGICIGIHLSDRISIENSESPGQNLTVASISVSKSNVVNLGKFKLTAYCTCKKCCGKSDGVTASGVKATPGRTIAVDPKIIPLGCKVNINGKWYIAEDTGSAVKGEVIDICMENHMKAKEFGVQYADIYYLPS